jgi:hypothetical protein
MPLRHSLAGCDGTGLGCAFAQERWGGALAEPGEAGGKEPAARALPGGEGAGRLAGPRLRQNLTLRLALAVRGAPATRLALSTLLQ